MKLQILFITVCALSTSSQAKRQTPRDIFEIALNGPIYKSTLKDIGYSVARFMSVYRQMCEYDGDYCVVHDMKKDDMNDAVTLFIDHLTKCEGLKHNGTALVDLCREQCYFGASRLDQCRKFGIKSKISSEFYRQLFGVIGDASSTLMTDFLQYVDEAARAEFHLGDFFLSDSKGLFNIRFISMSSFFVPYSFLMLQYASAFFKNPVARFLIAMTSLLCVMVSSYWGNRGWLPTIYAFAPCVFLITNTNTYVHQELWTGFASTLVMGLITAYCPNWFFRGFFQVIYIGFFTYSVYSIQKKLDQYANNLGILLMRCFNFIIVIDMICHLVRSLSFLDNQMNSYELLLMVVTGFSKDDGPLIGSIIRHFDELELALESTFNAKLLKIVLDALPFEVTTLRLMLTMFFYFLSFSFRTAFGIFPIISNLGLSGFSGSNLLSGVLYGHSTVFRTIYFLWSELSGRVTDTRIRYYNYVQFLLLLIMLWSSHEVFLLNVLLSSVIMIFTKSDHHYRNIDLMLKLRFSGAALGGDNHRPAHQNMENFVQQFCPLASHETIDPALLDSEESDFQYFLGGDAFPFNGSGPWMNLPAMNTIAAAFALCQWCSNDPITKKSVVRQSGSGTFAKLDGDYYLLTILHNIRGVTDFNVTGSGGTVKIRIDRENALIFKPEKGEDLCDYSIALPVSKSEMEALRKANPTMEVCEFPIYTGSPEDIKAVFVISGNGSNAVNQLSKFLIAKGFVAIGANLMRGDSGSAVLCADVDGKIYFLATISHGYPSKSKESAAALVAFCKTLKGITEQDELCKQNIHESLKETIFVMAAQFAIARNEDEKEELEKETLSVISERKETPNLREGALDPFVLAIALTANSVGFAWTPTTEGGDSEHGNNYENDWEQEDDRGQGRDNEVIHQRGRTKNVRKDIAAKKRREYHSYTRMHPSDPFVLACASVCDLAGMSQADLVRIWKEYNERNNLHGFYNLPFQGQIVAFNRLRGSDALKTR